MATLDKGTSQMADKSGDPLIGQRQANVADAGAITNLSVSITSVTDGVTDSYTAPTPAQGTTVTSNAATDLDDAAAALELLGGETNALAISAALLEDEVTTLAAASATLENEVTALRVTSVAILDVLEEHGLMTAS